jgi:uncharacterized NAD(P)/FAD-binding protein YdhS
MTLNSPLSSDRSRAQVRDELPKIAIVGRGFTGIVTAIALLKGITRPFHLVMFDPRPKIDVSEGLRHSATTLLNSRVRDLSVDPAVKEDFRLWLEGEDFWRQDPAAVDLDDAFVPGEVFSDYVYQRFSAALSGRTDVVVQMCPRGVTAVDKHPSGGISVFFGSEENLRFDAVFLATGFGLGERTDVTSAPRPVQNAIVAGGGVRAVNRALKLLTDGEATHVTLISSSRFLPQPHTRAAAGSRTPDGPLPATLLGAFRSLRAAANLAEVEGTGWQGIMNGFRLRAHDLWQGLSPEERSRFKRHLRPIYESHHRNRLPPEHHQRLHAAISEGAITVRKAKVERIATNGVLISTLTGFEVLPADLTIDCRVRSTDIDSPVLRSTILAGLARRDELDVGIVVDRSGRATGAQGFQGLFAMGPLGLGSLPDIDMVPVIVKQTCAAASSLDAWLDAVPEERATTQRSSTRSATG